MKCQSGNKNRQHYALNDRGELVHIYDAKPKSESYFCLSCGELMVPKQGKIRSWHFAHKNNVAHCSYETYLHTLAKQRLCERFLHSDTFKVRFKVPYQCVNKPQCCWADEGFVCNWTGYSTFDLKHFYTSCKEEQSYGGYRADVLASNVMGKYPPVFFEIYVSHPCSCEKINSGIKIIEFVIKNEADLEGILNVDVLEECDVVKFHNFERYIVECEPGRYKDICKFTLYENDKMFCSYPTCMTYMQHHPKAKMEVSIEQRVHFGEVLYSLYDFGALLASSKDPTLRICNLCKYHNGRMISDDWDSMHEENRDPIVCKLYKRFGTKKYCAPSAAKTCSFFKPYTEKQKQDIYRHFSGCYIWFRDDS